MEYGPCPFDWCSIYRPQQSVQYGWSQQIAFQTVCIYGITETERLWFTNYNADRRQLVQYRNVSSDYSVISSGAPQGSILGIVSRCSVLMYADDTVLYFASNSVSEIEDVLNCDC